MRANVLSLKYLFVIGRERGDEDRGRRRRAGRALLLDPDEEGGGRRADVTVYERNRADDTFGFGVVFSDETLDNFEKLRPRELPAHHPGIRLLGRHRDPLQGHACTASAATASAAARAARCCLILQERAARARREARASAAEVDDERRFADADLVVVADGINSRFRERARATISARGRPAAEQVRLDGLDPPARRLHLRLPGDRVGPLHRPRLPVRGGRARPGSSRPIPRPSTAPASSA